MKNHINHYTKASGWREDFDGSINAQLVLCFISPDLKEFEQVFNDIKRSYPSADIVSLTTGGEIFNEEVSYSSAVVAALEFAHTPYKVFSLDINEISESEDVGRLIGNKVNKSDLNSIMLFSDGLHTNGTALISGLTSVVGHKIPITGGLAGDNEKFSKTKVGLNSLAEEGKTVAIAFYGDNLVYGHGSAGGWDNFGPQRVITKAEGNVLYELDNQPALELYKKYLTEEQIENLPGSGLIYPLSISDVNLEYNDTVRTIVGVDEENQSLIFAGDIPEKNIARLMIGSFDRLIDGASQATEQACINKGEIQGDCLTLMISCIGRRLLMGQQISGEAEAVYENLKPGSKAIGFYSYGEIAPNNKNNLCQLHNQTMTITHLGEKKAA